MSQNNFAHVKIGTYEFNLKEDLEGHYIFEDSPAERALDIQGDATKMDLDSEDRLLWRMSDWSGGEGSRFWDPDDPTTYSYSEVDDTSSIYAGQAMNTRIAGQITGRPKRYRSTITIGESADDQKAFFAVGDGNLWICQNDQIWYNDFDTAPDDAWTEKTSNVPSGHVITAAGGVDDWVIYATADSNSQALYTAHTSKNGDDVVADSTTAFGGTSTNSAPLRERIVQYNGRVYGWTGRRLYEFDIFDSVNTAGDTVTALVKNANPGYRKVFDSGSESNVQANYQKNSNQGWWADITSSENAVFMLTGTRSMTRVFQYDVRKGGRVIWNLPVGFTGKSLAVQSGVLFCCGHWGGDTSSSSPAGAIFALPLATMQPTFVTYVREHRNVRLQMQQACASLGNQIMIAAANTGRVFIYDLNTNGLTMLDDLPWTYAGSGGGVDDGDKKIGDLIVYGQNRCAVVYRPRDASPGTTLEFWAWDTDNESDRQASLRASNTDYNQAPILYTGKFDFRMPYETKMLYGFHVAWEVDDNSTTSGLQAGQSIVIAYKLDGQDWSSDQTISSSTTPSSGVKGRHFIQISNTTTTEKFQLMQYRITLKGTRTPAGAGGTDYKPPIVRDVTVEARTLDTNKTWTLILRVGDDKKNATQIDHRFASQARTYLRTLRSNKNIVAFQDRYRYAPKQGSNGLEYSTHSVIVHSIQDVIERNSQGYVRVVLKAVKT